jgi:CheY-like chemotaxis protein
LHELPGTARKRLQVRNLAVRGGRDPDGHMRTTSHAPETDAESRWIPGWTTERPVEQALVLVADDDDDLRAIYRAVLCDAGFLVEEAVDGCDTWEKVRSLVPDVVVLDLVLPGVDGETLAHWIREDQRTTDVGVVMVSGHPAWDLEDRMLALGCRFLLKPCLPCDLVSAIRDALRDPRASVA